MKRYQIQRVLALLDSKTNELVFVPLHQDQDYLRPVSITEKIFFNDEFALVANDALIPNELWLECPKEGKFLKHCYQVIDIENGNAQLGIYIDKSSAQLMILRLMNASSYGKVWEISIDHITHEAHCFLQQAIINQTDYQTLNFQLFTFPGVTENCVGVKLMATPWNDESLQIQFDLTQKKLIAQQKQAGLPDSFIALLHKAAREDVRILVFDPIADPVKGLETYD